MVFGKLKKHWGPRICSWIPLTIWHRLLEIELVIPYYHVISDQNLAHVSGLYNYRSIRQFKMDLEFLLRSYVPIDLGDLVNYLDGIGRLPKRCFLLTFDDGFRELYDIVAPILYAKGIPAAFFLIASVINNRELCYPQKKSLLINALATLSNSTATREISQHLFGAGVKESDMLSAIRRISYSQRHILDELAEVVGCDFAAYAASAQPYLTFEQTRDLIQQGFAIGSHSVDHPLYSELSLEEQFSQTCESLNYLSNHLHYDCQSFAFPYRDTGVSLEFFQNVFADGHIKVTFGTGGLLRHFFPRNLSRFTIEGTNLPPAQAFARHFGKAFLRKAVGGITNNQMAWNPM